MERPLNHRRRVMACQRRRHGSGRFHPRVLVRSHPSPSCPTRVPLIGGRGGQGATDESACTPGSVPGRLAASRCAVIHLGLPLPAGSSGPPAGSGGQPSNACAGLRPVAQPPSLSTLLRVGFTEPHRSPGVRWSLTPPFHPYQPLLRGGTAGGLFSVALSRGSPRVAVNDHPALWSPDVPRRRGLPRRRDRPADSSVVPGSLVIAADGDQAGRAPARPGAAVRAWVPRCSQAPAHTRRRSATAPPQPRPDPARQPAKRANPAYRRPSSPRGADRSTTLRACASTGSSDSAAR